MFSTIAAMVLHHVVYGVAFGKVGRVLASSFPLRLVWGVESGSGIIIGVEINH